MLPSPIKSKKMWKLFVGTQPFALIPNETGAQTAEDETHDCNFFVGLYGGRSGRVVNIFLKRLLQTVSQMFRAAGIDRR